MKKLYEKNEVNFALVWIALYVLVMNIALQFCGGLDDLAGKTVPQLLVPVACITVLAVASTVWILRNSLAEKFGLCAFKGSKKAFLWFLPLIVMSCANLDNGLALTAPLAVTLLMMVNKAVAGYVEEIIFRGFLFKMMEKDNLKVAIIVNAITFGIGHIINLFNGADLIPTLIQVCYAMCGGYLFVILFYKSKSIVPCIVTHSMINALSIFNIENNVSRFISPIFLIVVSLSYAIYISKCVKVEESNIENEIKNNN